MEDELLAEKFAQWTKSLSDKSARISIYQHIRDIPYAIVPELRDPRTGPSDMIRMNMGSCVPKHFLMALMMGELGLPVKYVSYLFNWNDPAVKFPPVLKRVVKNMPISAHLATKINIDGRWILVDATYDLPLKKAGFSVNESWDGVSDTKNAVTPIEEVVHESLQERLSFSGKRVGEYTDKERSAYSEFTKKLNYWLEELRRR
ncbi:MAG: transglutaminase domain-containing protein [Candidatus Omnitrophota bacterium]|nr:transglutaminase domain-containing protein [Candidatus Omnitrophota bacterium]